MKTNKEQLMKYFATVLRNRALGKETKSLMSENLAFYFSRKELVEILKKKFGGTISKEHNLVELENKELLSLIGNEMLIISYMTEKWCDESPKIVPKKVAPNNRKPRPNDKKDSKTS